jgi:formate/nitrite transporter
MVVGLLEKQIKLGAMLRNWGLVYTGNLLGSLLIAALAVFSGLMGASANDFGGMTIRIAASKASLGFGQAVALGVLCNMLVCGAVWMSYGAKDIGGKIFSCFFPILLFITSGFEHSVANMFYIPAGIWAASNPAWLEAAKLSESALANLTWVNFFIQNLLPVTIGNIIGGSCLIGGVYWFSYLRKERQ